MRKNAFQKWFHPNVSGLRLLYNTPDIKRNFLLLLIVSWCVRACLVVPDPEGSFINYVQSMLNGLPQVVIHKVTLY